MVVHSLKSRSTERNTLGSILGPILFTIFINDLPDEVKSTCKILADYTKLYNSPKSHCELQKDIDSLVKWSDTWNLYFNAEKCKVLHIGRTNQEKEYVMRTGGKEIKISKCNEEKDLVVTFDKK